jgi:hypothetical protein
MEKFVSVIFTIASAAAECIMTENLHPRPPYGTHSENSP